MAVVVVVGFLEWEDGQSIGLYGAKCSTSTSIGELKMNICCAVNLLYNKLSLRVKTTTWKSAGAMHRIKLHNKTTIFDINQTGNGTVCIGLKLETLCESQRWYIYVTFNHFYSCTYRVRVRYVLQIKMLSFRVYFCSSVSCSQRVCPCLRHDAQCGLPLSSHKAADFFK